MKNHINEYSYLFPPLLSIYTLLFDMAGVPSKKLQSYKCQIIVSTASAVKKKSCVRQP